jgi:putative thioredoxin
MMAEADIAATLSQLELSLLAFESPPRHALKKTIHADPDDLEARYRLGAHCLLQSDHEGALEQYLEIVRRDRKFRDDGGRKALLSVFDMLKGTGELVARYRTRMLQLMS